MSAAGPARLVALRWRPFRLPLRHRFEAAHAAIEDRTGVLLELEAADGVTGIGEASPMPSLGDGTVADVLALLDERAAAIVRDPAVFADPVPTSARPSTGSGPSTRSGRPGGRASLQCALD